MKYNNKEIILPKNKHVFLPLIIFSNLFPLYGVISYNWTIFSVVYIYWLELIIISSFQLLKIMLARGDANATFFSKLFLVLRFFFVRTALFFFYLLFIIVFLGFLAGGKEEGIAIFDVIFFKGDFFKIAILSFFLYNLVEFSVLFMINGEYKNAKPEDNYQLFDAHIIVVHIVVVLGTFLYQGVTEELHWNHKSAMIACVSLFVFVKIIADIIRQSLSGNLPGEEQGKYI